jgi:peptide-methionine (R)-S-oxide reductase
MLSADQYAVLRQEGTERPFTSPLLHEERAGVFSCAGCDLPDFSSKTKFDSGTGWPSFWAPLDNAVSTKEDTSFGMTRSAVLCRRCASHLGHVFDDGPKPTGLRYCMNGLALKFVPDAA